MNPHTFRHTHLKRTCLPFHHPGGLSGAPSRVRTYNQRFRRPLLFQLSYGCMLPTSGASEADYREEVRKRKFFLEILMSSMFFFYFLSLSVLFTVFNTCVLPSFCHPEVRPVLRTRLRKVEGSASETRIQIPPLSE